MKARFYSLTENRQYKKLYEDEEQRNRDLSAYISFENNARIVNENTLEVQVNNNITATTIFQTNYCIVTQDDYEYCYYITAKRLIAKGVYQFTIKIDGWQTYVNALSWETGFTFGLNAQGHVAQTNIVGALAARHNRKLPIEKASPVGTPTTTPLIDLSNGFYCVAIFGTYGGCETLVINTGEDPRLLSNALTVATFNAPLSTRLTLNPSATTPAWIDCTCLKTYIVPASLINTDYLIDERKVELKGTGAMDSLITDAWEYPSSRVETSIYVDNDMTKHIFVGTNANRIQLPTLDIIGFSGKVACYVGFGEVAVYLEINGQRLDLSTDFEMPLIYSDAAQKMLQNNTSFAIKTVGNVVGAAASLASGNYVGAALAAISQSKDASAYLTTHVGGATITGNATAWTTLSTGGIMAYVFDVANADELEYTLNERGYIYNSDNVNLNFINAIRRAWNLKPERKYIRFSDVVLSGAIPFDARDEIENELKNGIYIDFYANE